MRFQFYSVLFLALFCASLVAASPHELKQALFNNALEYEIKSRSSAIDARRLKRNTPTNRTEPISLAIVGAGASGLYSAYLLQKEFPDDFDITIFEEEEQRVGGRIFTYKFSEEPFQYAEVGAMRIPVTHELFLNLLRELQVPTIEFIFSDDDELLYINGKRAPDGSIMTKKYAREHPDELGFMPIQVVAPGENNTDSDFEGIVLRLKPNVSNPEKYDNVVSLFNAVYGELVDELNKDFLAFVDNYDRFSVYSYFQLTMRRWIARDVEQPLDPIKIDMLTESVLHYVEVVETATGHNLHGVVEMLLHERVFGVQEWYTVRNGMSNFPKALEAQLLPGTIRKGIRVIALTGNGQGPVNVTYTDRESYSPGTEEFDAVLVTAPFGSVRLLDLQLPLTYEKRQAIRTLQYDHSTKVFIQFPERWWEESALRGGSSRTDLPIRTVVYPSYGLDEPATDDHVLQVSYTWGNDAMMWGNSDNQTRKEVALRDIGHLHNRTFDPNSISDDQIFSHTWNEAFANFGPNQYQWMLLGMLPECGVHFAGEHLSTYHAWINGALNSATRAVREILVFNGVLDVDEAFERFPDIDFTADTWRAYVDLAIDNDSY